MKARFLIMGVPPPDETANEEFVWEILPADMHECTVEQTHVIVVDTELPPATADSQLWLYSAQIRQHLEDRNWVEVSVKMITGLP